MDIRSDVIRICQSCRKGPLRQVAGGLGRMVRCSACGYTGPASGRANQDRHYHPPLQAG